MEDAAEDQVQPQDNENTLVDTGTPAPVNQNESQPAAPAPTTPTAATSLPTLDQFLKDGPKDKVPTLDEWMDNGLPSANKDKSAIGALWGGEKFEDLSKEQREAVHNSFLDPYLDAFGASFKESYNPLLSDETKADFKKYVDGDQFAKGVEPIQNAYTDALAQQIRMTSAFVVRSAEEVGSALWAPIPATLAGVTGTLPVLANDVSKLPFNLGNRTIPLINKSASELIGENAPKTLTFLQSPEAAAFIPGDVLALGASFHEGVANGGTARAGVWDGTVKATEQEQEVMNTAARTAAAQKAAAEYATVKGAHGQSIPMNDITAEQWAAEVAKNKPKPLPPSLGEAVPVQDVHDLALKNAPEAVGERNKLMATQEVLRNERDNLREQRYDEAGKESPFAEPLADKKEQLASATSENSKRLLSTSIDDLQAKHDQWISENAGYKLAAESPAMSAVTQKLQAIDHRLQDIAKEGIVPKAYRDAQATLDERANIPAPEEKPEYIKATPFTPEAVEEKAKEQDNLFTAATEQAKKDKVAGRSDQFSRDKARAAEKAAADIRAAKSEEEFRKAMGDTEETHAPPATEEDALKIKAQRDRIIEHRTKVLTDAGVKPEAVQAEATLRAAYYESRAAKFGGKRGTAEDMYHEDASRVERHENYGKFSKSEKAKAKAQETDTSLAKAAKEKYQRDAKPAKAGKQGKLEVGKAGKREKATATPIQNYLRDKGVKFNPHSGEIENIDNVPPASEFNDDMREYNIHASGERVDKDWLEEQLDNERKGNGNLTDEQYAKDSKSKELDRIINAVEKVHAEGRTDKGMADMSTKEIHDFITREEAERQSAAPQHEVSDYHPELAELASGELGVFRTAINKASAIIGLFHGSDIHTLIHETGHEFAAQFLEDAEHPDATPKMKEEAATFMKWAGIRTRLAPAKGTAEYRQWIKGQEKAADGFLRYMRDGEAPSKALEPIFKQFKDWIVAIYNGIMKEGVKDPLAKFKPSPEVKAIFDGWLTHREADIIPEHDAGKLMADMHETDAKATEPKDADAVRDNVEKEIDQGIQKNKPEISDAITNANQTTELTGTSSGDAASAEGTGSIEVGHGANEESGTVSASGNNTGAEGTGTRAGSDSAGSATGEPARESTEPSWESQWDSAVAKVGGNIVGKSDEVVREMLGNIRLENLTDDGKLHDFMRFVAKKMNVKFDTPVTDDMALDLAQAVGDRDMNMDFLRDITNKDGIPLSVRVAVGRETLRNGMKDLQEKQNLLNQSGSDADALAFQKALVTQKYFMETISGVAGESGRTLRAFKNISDTEMKNADEINDLFMKTVGKTPKQVREISKQMQLVFESSKDSEVEGGANPEMAAFVAKMNNPKWYDYILAYRNNAILSGPITHIHYIDAGLINALYDPAKVALASAFSPEVRLGEAGAMYHSLISGSIKGLKVAAEVIKNGNEADIPEILKSDLSKIKLPLGLDVPTRILSGVHVFMKNLRYEQEIARAAFRSAIHDGLQEGSVEFKNRVSNLQVNPTPEVMDTAMKTAKVETYLADLDRNSFTGKIVNALGSNPVAQLFVPFAKMEANIKFRTLQEVPIVNLFTKETRTNLSGVAGYDESIEALTGKTAHEEGLVEGTPPYNRRVAELKNNPTDEMKRVALSDAKAKQAVQIAAIGMSGVLGGMVIGFQNNINGNGPSDPQKRAEWLLTHTPNSVQIGNFAIPMKSLGKAGLALGMMAELRDGVNGLTDDENKKAASEFVDHLRIALLSGTFVDNLSRISDAIQHPETHGAKFIQSMVDEFLPFNAATNQINREFIDPDYRDVRSEGAKNFWGIIDSMKSRTPLLSQDLPAKNDMFGQPIMNDSLYFHSTKPEEAYRYQNDPVVQTMDRLGKGMTMIGNDIHGVKLNSQQYNEYSQKAGVITKMRLDNLIKTDGFQSMSRAAQIEHINQEIKVSRIQARNLIMAKYPEIMRQAVAQKRAALGR